MRPASGLLDRAVGVERREAGKGIGLEDTLEVFEVSLRVLASAIGRVREPDRRRRRIGTGAVVAHVGPQPPGLGLSLAWCKDRNRRVVGMQLGGNR